MAAVAAPTSATSVMKLNNGLALPVIGIGVYLSAVGSETKEAVLSALSLGYRHIDTAQAYKNEKDVGDALRESGLPREEVWVTSKIFPSTWADEQQAYDNTLKAVKESVGRIGQYIDLMLLHAPGQAAGRPAAWRALEDAVQQGLLKSIGVSNFGIPHLEKLAQTAKLQPAVNQIELHPFLQWRKEVAYCQEKGIVVEAYSPLAKSRKLSDERVVAVANKHGKTPAQVLIRWSLQKGYVVLPKSVNPDRQKSNLDVFGFQLGAEDMQALDGCEENLVTGWDPIRDDPV